MVYFLFCENSKTVFLVYLHNSEYLILCIPILDENIYPTPDVQEMPDQ